MSLTKFADGQAFVFCDLDDAPASGPVRVAPKVLQSTSKDLARSMTYRFALFAIKRGGLAAGVNADDDHKSALDRLEHDVHEHLAATHWRFFHATPGATHSTEPFTTGVDRRAEAAGIVAAAAAARGSQRTPSLEGARIVIDRIDAASSELVDSLADSGARIVAVGTKRGTLRSDELDAAALRAVIDGAKPDELGELQDDSPLEVESDILLSGAKMGAIDHTNADTVAAQLVVPIGLLAFTTKAAIMLQRRNVVVLPDFLSLAGGSLVVDGTATDAATAAGQVAEVTQAVVADREQLPSVVAALRAEAFLASWHEPVFGRPFAP